MKSFLMEDKHSSIYKVAYYGWLNIIFANCSHTLHTNDIPKLTPEMFLIFYFYSLALYKKSQK